VELKSLDTRRKDKTSYGIMEKVRQPQQNNIGGMS